MTLIFLKILSLFIFFTRFTRTCRETFAQHVRDVHDKSCAIDVKTFDIWKHEMQVDNCTKFVYLEEKTQHYYIIPLQS